MTSIKTNAVPDTSGGGNPIVPNNDAVIALREAAAGLTALADKLQATDALSPLKLFLAEGVLVPAPGADVATADIVKVFTVWCRFKELPVPPVNETRRALGRLLHEQFGVAQSHSVPRGGGQVRGFRGIGFRPVEL